MSAKSKFLKSPWLELGLMLIAVLLSHIGLIIVSIFAQAPTADEMSTQTIVLWLTGLFLISFAIAVVTVIAGIGGGVIFTPIMMAFTPIDSVVIRATGLIVAMFSGLISTGLFLRKGLGHFKLCIVLAASQGVGALIGAQSAITAAAAFGDSGEGYIRIALGIILVIAAVYFLAGGKNLEWPKVERVDPLTQWMRLEHSYREESDGNIHIYKITRIALGLALVSGVGFIGGFFGMGAGWALTPVQNIALGVPLKAATANSGIILSMVGCVSVWPFMLAGGIIPLFVLPLLSGQVVGGLLGAIAMVKVRVSIVRVILIGIMVFTSFGLITDGLAILAVIARIPGQVSMIIFMLIMAASLLVVFFKMRGKQM